ncbi:MAG: T9SS type A sorting domain-containing protein [Bacteroidetes bacterium]|nr:T9SS type A sorting domain-containing protein [Bacteroidota bacterium]
MKSTLNYFLSYLLIFLNGLIYAQNPGVLDPSFNIGTSANGSVMAIAVQNDGKIIIGGSFTSYNGIPANRIARLNIDGSIDTTFDVGTGANGNVNAICVLSDGNIIIGGSFTSINGMGIVRIAKLTTTGILWSTINAWVHGNPNGVINSIISQSDGKILVGGDFTIYGGYDWRGVVRIDEWGIVDQSFNSMSGSTLGANGSVKCLAVQGDGKIIVGGLFSSFNGNTRNRLARLNANGTIDPSFNTGPGFAGSGISNGVYCTKIQSDGKILVGGDFTSFNGVPLNKYGRLNSNSSFDSGFNSYTISGSVASFNIQSDGKIIVSGWFTNFAGSAINHIGRVNSNGIIDASFTAGTGAGNTIYTSTLQNDGKILIGGLFTSYNGTGANRFARIMGDCTPPSAPTGQASQSFCINATISDLVATGSGIQWYSSSTGGTPLGAQTQLTSGASYYASQTVTCASLSRLQVTVTINQPVDPTFDQLGPICQGSTLNLSTISNNEITGIWSPAIDNSVTTTYSFIPNANECANSTTMTVVVESPSTPTFTQLPAICSGGTISLPSVSNENISGTWSPAINNTATTTYTFTPNTGQCANTQTMTVTVNPLPTVTLAAFNSVCDTTGLVNLSGGSPAGGTFAGTSVSNNSFNTSVGIGSYPITYSYTNSNGCSSTATQNLVVISCAGSNVIELIENGIVLYPNPTLDAFTIETNEDLTGKSFIIHDVSGRVLSTGTLQGSKTTIQVSSLSTGSYYINLPETNQTLKFIKQ